MEQELSSFKKSQNHVLFTQSDVTQVYKHIYLQPASGLTVSIMYDKVHS